MALLGLVVFLPSVASQSWGANTNPTITFQPSPTNFIHPVGKDFRLNLYIITGFSNITNQITNRSGTNFSQRVYSNDVVNFAADFTNPSDATNLLTADGWNGLRFDAATGVLSGTPKTNFILNISNEGIRVVVTNRVWLTTNTSSNGVFSSTNGPITNTSFTNRSSTNPAYRFVFQAVPPIRLSDVLATNRIPVGTTVLPKTNAHGLTYVYSNLSGPGHVTNSTNLVARSAGTLFLRVSLEPGTDEIWAPATNQIILTATNTSESVLAFVTDLSASNYTRTSLTYLQSTPLTLSNLEGGGVTFSLDRSTAGHIYESNRLTYLEARSGTGNVVVKARRAATASNGFATAVQTIRLARASNPITFQGVFANTNRLIITNPATKQLVLSATASNGTVVFSATNTNRVQITNGTTLRLVANGTSTVVASVTNANTNNYLPTEITSTVIVSWPLPAAPVFTSTNRQDGTVGTAFTYTLSAEATNTDAFPVAYAATNLPPGLTFTPANQISGTPTQAGLYRIQLTASNEGGVSTLILTSTIAPSPAFSVTRGWTNLVALGSGTNTNGSYTLSSLPAGLGTNTTNLTGFTQPVLVLRNTNTNPASVGWFAGITNLSVVFSNSQTNLNSLVPLNVQPAPPVLTIPPAVTGSPGLPLAITGTVSPPGLGNIPGYPLVFGATQLPPGIFLNPISGVLSGKPLFAGQTVAMVWASNGYASSATSSVTFDIQALAGNPMQMSLAFTDVPGTYAVPNLPPGLTLDPANGRVTGNPQAVGTFDLSVDFVRAGTASTQRTNRILTIRPPAPIPRLPTNSVTARLGIPLHLQPWVTGPGWSWAGADPLTGTTFGSNWTREILVRNRTVVLASNRNGAIRPSLTGLTFQGSTNPNELYLLWNSSLPSSWPWQAVLRLRIPGSLTNSNSYAYPVLGAIRARSPSFPTNYLDEYADGGLSAVSAGVFPASTFASPTTSNLGTLDSIGTNEVAIRIRFETNSQALVISASTNLATNTFVGLTTNTNLAADWSLTNAAAAFRLGVGGGFSNQAVAPGQILLRDFVVLPLGVGFYASNLPAGLRCDAETGTIYGTPTSSSSQLVYLYATNAQGTNFTGFRLRVIP